MKRSSFFLSCLLGVILMIACQTGQKKQTNQDTPMTLKPKTQAPELPTRDTIPDKNKWNLTDLYASDADWEKEFKWVQGNLPSFKKFEGKLSESAEALLACLNFRDQLNNKIDRLDLYASLSKDLDVTNTKYQALADRVTNLFSQSAAAQAFIDPEILLIPQEQISSFLSSNKDLKIYQQELDDLLRTREHRLSPDQEKLLALNSPVEGGYKDTYDLFTNGDFVFDVIKDENGNDKRVTVGSYFASLSSTDRAFRERYYRAFHKPFVTNQNTIASLYNGATKGRLFEMQARHYKSILEMALDRDNIPASVFETLTKVTNSNLKPLHRWAKIKKEKMGLKELHPFDAFVTLSPLPNKKVTFDEGKEIVLKALTPLGADYVNGLKTAFENRWIDVHETRGKKGGAYNSGATKGTHSYVLLNWNNSLDDVMTLAHELGHCMHSTLTEKTQPYVYNNHSIFLAEIASTTNELLVMKYLTDQALTPEEKRALIEQELSGIQTTFYRQTQFAEFEKTVLTKTEQGEIMTADKLNSTFGALYKRFWGPEMILDKEEAVSWARIPHFYNHYYVYQYATGLSAAYAFVDVLLKEGQPAVNRYLEFLSAGESDYPINVLKKAGVDMTTDKPELAVVKRMNGLLDELEKIKK